MKLTLRAWLHNLPLSRPYRLSFATLDKFETIYVALEGEGKSGFGEITPLPWYGGETVAQAELALAEAGKELAAGGPFAEVTAQMAAKYPMTASGLACAFETWGEGQDKAFRTPLSVAPPLAALCAGDSPASMTTEAKRLIGAGYCVFKLKAGRSPEFEESLVRAAIKELPAGGSMRLDANQAYSPADALELCRRLEDLGSLAMLEQPFKAEMWSECETLASATSFPLMMDESIWSSADISRAKDCGAKYVKLKLCKHPGMAATAALVEEAQRLGLGVVFGNGVQTALGNHLEARTHINCGLTTAAEANGFLKVREHPFQSAMSVTGGTIVDQGIEVNSENLATGRLVAEVVVNTVA